MLKTATQLTDDTGQELRLGDLVGRGGEGEVYRIAGRPKVVAKLYRADIAAEREQKISAMLPLGSEHLRKFCAWPTGSIREGRKFRGLLMPLVEGGKELHVLQGPKSRKSEFPDAGFGFIVRVATNVARSVATVHAAGCAIGDINERGILVGRNGIVTLIDCDSFQVVAERHKYSCDVGSPSFTPPELQGLNLRGLHRTSQHDDFGLAVLIFLLLFMGRHPFAGRYANGSIELEEAIKDFRYAYSSDHARTGMTPPPNTLPITAGAGTEIAVLFERAFSPLSLRSSTRPTAEEWVIALERLEKALVQCPWNKAHVFVKGQTSCPWCDVEQRTGVDLFRFVPTSSGHAATIDIEVVWKAIGALKVPQVPSAIPVPPIQQQTPRPLPADLIEKVTRYESLEFEENRARDLTRTLRGRCSDAAEAIEKLRGTLVRRVPKIGQLDRLRKRVPPSIIHYMLAIVPAAILLSGPAAARLGLLAGLRVTPIEMLIATVGSCAAILWAMGRYIVWRSAGAERRYQRLLQAAIDKDPNLRGQIEDLSRAETEARFEEEGAMRLVDAMTRTLAVLSAEIRTAVDKLRVELDDGDKRASEDHKRAKDRLGSLRASAKKFEAELVSQRAIADKLRGDWQKLEDRRRQELQKLRNQARAEQLDEFLDKHFISGANIQGITRQLQTALRSYSIETAADISAPAVRAVPGFGEVRTRRMVDWRRQCESGFKFDAGKAIDPAKAAAIDRRHAAAVRRIERDLTAIRDRGATWISQFSSALEPVKEEARRTAAALAQAKANRSVIDTISIPL